LYQKENTFLSSQNHKKWAQIFQKQSEIVFVFSSLFAVKTQVAIFLPVNKLRSSVPLKYTLQ